MSALDLRTEAVPLLRETFSEFQRHNSHWLAASIAYFTLFAIAPLIIVIVEIAGFVLGQHQQVLNTLYDYLAQTARPEAANGIRSIVQATFSHPRADTVSQIVAWFFFFLGAIGLFGAFQQAFNTIWDVTPTKAGFVDTIRSRAVSFGIVFIVAVLLLISLLLNSFLSAAEQSLAQSVPAIVPVSRVLDYVVSFALIAALFALLFEYLPDRKIEWREVWPGALVSALLFVVGQALLAWYLGRAGISSTFGAFGGLVAFLIWANYSAQIVLFGAEFTHVYSRRIRVRRRPSSCADGSRSDSLRGRS
jgi:membrane protein